MSSGVPRSVRFESAVEARLAAYLARHPGMSGAAATNRLVDEGIRMDEHPGVFFREGPTGRRAVLVGGPDIRAVIRAVKSARAHEPDLEAGEILDIIEQNTGLTRRLIDTAIRYWSAYPVEIDAWIVEADRVEEEMLAAWERQQTLLAK